MKAFLLAAGRGTRLKPYTDTCPKCLMPINGTPLLEIWIDLLIRHGVTDILINTHHHADQVTEFVNGLKNTKQASLILFHEKTLLGSGGTVLANKHWVSEGEPFVIAYADNLTNENLTDMIAAHAESAGLQMILTMALMEAENPKACGIASMDEKSRITDFVEKPENPKGNLANAGIYIADYSVFDYFPPADKMPDIIDFGFHVLPELVGQMAGYPLKGYIRDIGTIPSYETACHDWKHHSQG